jgi:hypothetical protein
MLKERSASAGRFFVFYLPRLNGCVPHVTVSQILQKCSIGHLSALLLVRVCVKCLHELIDTDWGKFETSTRNLSSHKPLSLFFHRQGGY